MLNGLCGVIVFGLNGICEEVIEFMDRLKFICIVIYVVDVCICVLYFVSYIYCQFIDEQLCEVGVVLDLICLLVGIENVSDIIVDIE